MHGTTVSHYPIMEKLAGGGLGVVCPAVGTQLKLAVALNFLSEELAKDRQAVGPFQREALAAFALNHSNICTICDIVAHEGRPFIVMDLLESQALKRRTASQPSTLVPTGPRI
jgi:serine/threonine protein kinase